VYDEDILGDLGEYRCDEDSGPLVVPEHFCVRHGFADKQTDDEALANLLLKDAPTHQSGGLLLLDFPRVAHLAENVGACFFRQYNTSATSRLA
jgi:hypothetical protein